MNNSEFVQDKVINALYCCKCGNRCDVFSHVPMRKYANCPFCGGIAVVSKTYVPFSSEMVNELDDLFSDITK